MTDHGGAREGAGRPQRRYLREQMPAGQTPAERLWVWLAEKCGPELAEEAHLFFNKEKRAYEKRRRENQERKERK